MTTFGHIDTERSTSGIRIRLNGYPVAWVYDDGSVEWPDDEDLSRSANIAIAERIAEILKGQES